MRKVILSVSLLFLTMMGQACADNGGGGGGTATDAVAVAGGASDLIYGTWIYENPSSTSTHAKGMGVILEKGGSVNIISMVAQKNGNNATMIFRKSIGTFTLNGELVNLKYSYETCDPVGTETLKAKIDPKNSDRLLVSSLDGSVIFSMYRHKEGGSSDLLFTGVEDKNCNLM